MLAPACSCPPETFWFLLHDTAHWEFELFLMLLFDGLVGICIWPFVKKGVQHYLNYEKEESLTDSESKVS